MNKHQLLTEKETAAYVRMSISYLQKDRMNCTVKGRTPGPAYIKIGKSVRYARDDLDQWLLRHRVHRGAA